MYILKGCNIVTLVCIWPVYFYELFLRRAVYSVQFACQISIINAFIIITIIIHVYENN